MECNEYRENILAKIESGHACTKTKISKTQFGIAAACFLVVVFGYLIALTSSIGSCADESELHQFKETVIEQNARIEASVERMEGIFTGYIERTEKRDDKQDKQCEKLKERVIKLEHGSGTR